jgi:peptidoglycan/xylan/chitin deacetylase (PgdA/CDA1 family)
MNNSVSTSLLSLSFAMVCSAGPVTTVAWNGYPGAATFTFDDACASQLNNVVPALKSRKINATFFLYNSGNAFSNAKDKWVAAAKDGNELGNHTSTHARLDTSSNGASEVSGMATLLRNADPSIEAVTLAYPGCGVGSASAVSAENFIARGCVFGNGPYTPLPWKSQPSWLEVGSVYIDTDAKATGPVLTALDAAKTGGGWISTLNHGVSGDWISVTTTNVNAMFDRAIKNGLWISTFQNVGAYYRAHFTMDAVTATKNGNNWDMKWTSPHAKMPKSVKLRVNLASATFGTGFVVTQNNVAIAPESDGSYVIDFMKLAMTVSPKSTAIQPRAWQLPSDFALRLDEQGIAVTGFGHDIEVRVTDLRGTTVFQGRSSNGMVPLAKSRNRGILFVSLTDPASGAVAQRTLNSIR